MTTTAPERVRRAPVRTTDYGDVQRVTILTPTIAERAELLKEAQASVAAQTEGVRHLSMLDTKREGPAAIRTRLLKLVETEYVGFLDDDDVLDTTHVEALMALLANGRSLADLAWSRCRLKVAQGVDEPRFMQPIRPDYNALLNSGRNYVPVTVIARTSAIREAGGFNPADRYEDYELWRRMLRLGHRFAHHPHETWTYRFLGANRTWTG